MAKGTKGTIGGVGGGVPAGFKAGFFSKGSSGGGFGGAGLKAQLASIKNAGDGLVMHLGAGLQLPVPADRAAHYKPFVRRDQLLLGIRPEHLSEQRKHMEPGHVPFTAPIDAAGILSWGQDPPDDATAGFPLFLLCIPKNHQELK